MTTKVLIIAPEENKESYLEVVYESLQSDGVWRESGRKKIPYGPVSFDSYFVSKGGRIRIEEIEN